MYTSVNRPYYWNPWWLGMPYHPHNIDPENRPSQADSCLTPKSWQSLCSLEGRCEFSSLILYILMWRFPKIRVPLNHPCIDGLSLISDPFLGTSIFGTPHIFQALDWISEIQNSDLHLDFVMPEVAPIRDNFGAIFWIIRSHQKDPYCFGSIQIKMVNHVRMLIQSNPYSFGWTTDPY